MGSNGTTLCSNIRTRHGEIYQKLRALRTAVNEHFRNIQVRVELGDLKRPSSGVYRAPKYVILLTGIVNTEVNGLRSKLTQANIAGQCSEAEYEQMGRLVADLEMQCKHIDLQMKTRFKEPEEVVDPIPDPVVLPKLGSPLADPSSVPFTGPPSDCSSSKRGILKRNISQEPAAAPVEVKCPPLNTENPKKVTFGPREPQSSKRSFLFRQTSNLGYPYGSCFPALPPVPKRRRYVAENASLAKSFQTPLKTFSNVYSKREKSWLY